jgi:Cft2 family RNA processing exonuclease
MFVGYSDPESPAGQVRSSTDGGEVVIDRRRHPVKRRCRVDQFTLSAHATRDGLLGYARKVQPAKIVLVHGDPPAVGWFARELPKVCPRSEVIVPPPGQTIEI